MCLPTDDFTQSSEFLAFITFFILLLKSSMKRKIDQIVIYFLYYKISVKIKPVKKNDPDIKGCID